MANPPVGNHAAAEDLLSDVFLDAWRHAGRFEGRSSVATWIMAIARFKALSALRRRTDEELTIEIESSDEELTIEIESSMVDAADDPETAFEKKSRGEQIRRAISRLSREHAEVIDLVYYHDKSVDEVAHVLGIPPATVKTRMFYARKRLGEMVAA